MIQVRKIEDNDEKIEIMKICDEAFPVRLFLRPNRKDIVQRIISYALFYAAFLKSGGGELPVGYAALYANDFETRTAFISNIGVLTEYQRNHVGSMLMEKCLSEAKRRGMNRIRLEVLNTNRKAVSFYRCWDFEYEPDHFTEGDGGTSYMSRSL